MFYAQLVLAKKGALGKVWLAAHWDRKLTKTQINSTDISKSVESIMHPVAPFALRLTAHLLLGVVRIYSRKVKYLLSDCTDALTKIKMAFRPGMVDLPPDANVAAINSITLPEHAADIDLNIPLAGDITFEPIGEEVAPINTALWGKITLPPVRPASPPKETEYDILARAEEELEDEDDIFYQSAEKLRRDSAVYGGTPVTPIPYEDTSFQVEEFGVPGDLGEYPPTPASVPVTPRSTLAGGVKTPATEQLPLSPVDRIMGETLGETPEQLRPEKRKAPPVDTNIELSSRLIKEQLRNTTPITRGMVLAPVTKKALLQKEKEVHTLYRITNIEGLGFELLDMFALKMVDGPRDVPTPDKVCKEKDLSTGTIPIPPTSRLGDEDTGTRPASPLVDFGIPPSSRPTSPTGPEETIEEYEPREEGELPLPDYIEETEEPWSERTKKMHAYLDKTFGDNQTISYHNLVQGKKAHTVAGTFFELLVLKSRNLIDLDQDEPYADIYIQKTEHFYDPQQ